MEYEVWTQSIDIIPSHIREGKFLGAKQQGADTACCFHHQMLVRLGRPCWARTSERLIDRYHGIVKSVSNII